MKRWKMQLLFARAVRASLGVAGVLAITTSIQAERQYVKGKQGKRPRPIVAVDNVCAFPNLKTLPDGTVIAVGFNCPAHGGYEADVDCWASEDGGHTWHKRGTPGPHEPGSCRVNHAVGLANNGDLVVLCGGTTNVFQPPRPNQFLRVWISRSPDGGRTWSIDRSSAPLKAPDGDFWFPFGDIYPGKDGALRVGVYSACAVNRPIDRAYVLRSSDDGRIWDDFVLIENDPKRDAEPTLLHLRGGNWLAAVRRTGLGGEIHLYDSADDARSWNPRGPMTAKVNSPANLLRLHDGRVLITYGNHADGNGVDVRISDDHGNSWSDPYRVCDVGGDSSYPSSVALPDGQVLTAYYARRIEGHDRYHLGVVRWNLESLGASAQP